MLMVQYLQNNGGKVTLEAIAKPDRELTSRLRVLELGLEHRAVCHRPDPHAV